MSRIIVCNSLAEAGSAANAVLRGTNDLRYVRGPTGYWYMMHSDGTNWVPNGPVFVGTWANLLLVNVAEYPTYSTFCVTDQGYGGRSWWWSDGTYLHPMNGSLLLDNLPSTGEIVSAANTDAQVLRAVTIPLNMMQVWNHIQIQWDTYKSGTTDTITEVIAFGTTGTSADAQLYASTVLATTTRQLAQPLIFSRAAATAVQRKGAGNLAALNQEANSSTGARQGSVNTNVGNMGNVSNIISLSTQSNGTTDTCTVGVWRVMLYA